MFLTPIYLKYPSGDLASMPFTPSQSDSADSARAGSQFISSEHVNFPPAGSQSMDLLKVTYPYLLQPVYNPNTSLSISREALTQPPPLDRTFPSCLPRMNKAPHKAPLKKKKSVKRNITNVLPNCGSLYDALTLDDYMVKVQRAYKDKNTPITRKNKEKLRKLLKDISLIHSNADRIFDISIKCLYKTGENTRAISHFLKMLEKDIGPASKMWMVTHACEYKKCAHTACMQTKLLSLEVQACIDILKAQGKDGNAIKAFFLSDDIIYTPADTDIGDQGLIQQELQNTYSTDNIDRNDFVSKGAPSAHVKQESVSQPATLISALSYNQMISNLIHLQYSADQIRTMLSKTVVYMNGNVKLEMRHFVGALRKLAAPDFTPYLADVPSALIDMVHYLAFPKNARDYVSKLLQGNLQIQDHCIVDFHFDIMYFIHALPTAFTRCVVEFQMQFVQSVYRESVFLTFSDDLDKTINNDMLLKEYIQEHTGCATTQVNFFSNSKPTVGWPQGRPAGVSPLTSIYVTPSSSTGFPQSPKPTAFQTVYPSSDPSLEDPSLDASHARYSPPVSASCSPTGLENDTPPSKKMRLSFNDPSQSGRIPSNPAQCSSTKVVHLSPYKDRIYTCHLFCQLRKKGLPQDRIKNLFLKSGISLKGSVFTYSPTNSVTITSEVVLETLIQNLLQHPLQVQDICCIMDSILDTPTCIVVLDILANQLYETCQKYIEQYYQDVDQKQKELRTLPHKVKEILIFLGIDAKHFHGLKIPFCPQGSFQLVRILFSDMLSETLLQKVHEICGHELDHDFQAILDNSMCVNRQKEKHLQST